MSPLSGETRTRIKSNHALIAEDGYVTAPLFGWHETEGVVLVSPAMQGGAGGPRFTQYLVPGGSGCHTTGAAPGVERFVFVLQGTAQLDGAPLVANDFVWFPPDAPYQLSVPVDARLLVFEKRYEPLAGVATPTRITGSAGNAPQEPFMGDSDAMLTTLLPVAPAFDIAVNVFTFQPGTPLPFVETHVMEHGLYLQQGQGIYRLDEQWYPVQAGDAIWMASYCPQWFVAVGKQPASYIYYKDIHRDPLFAGQAGGVTT